MDADVFEYETDCPICGEQVTVTATATSDRSGQVFVEVNPGPVYEHTCPDRALSYDGILSALG